MLSLKTYLDRENEEVEDPEFVRHFKRRCGSEHNLSNKIERIQENQLDSEAVE